MSELASASSTSALARSCRPSAARRAATRALQSAPSAAERAIGAARRIRSAADRAQRRRRASAASRTRRSTRLRCGGVGLRRAPPRCSIQARAGMSPRAGSCTTSRRGTSCSSPPPATSPPNACAPPPRAIGGLARGLTGGERLDRAVELMWETFSEPHFWAAIEAVDGGPHQPRAATWPCCRRNARSGPRSGRPPTRSTAPGSSAHPRYPLVRDLILTSMRGVGLTYAFDPRDPRTDPHLSLWRALARTLLE